MTMRRLDAMRAIYPQLEQHVVVTIMGAVAAELQSIGHRPNFFYLQHAMGLASSMGPRTRGTSSLYLLPSYDEYLIAYTDRSAAIGSPGTGAAAQVIFGRPTIVVNGRVVGTWKATPGKGAAVVVLNPAASLRANPPVRCWRP